MSPVIELDPSKLPPDVKTAFDDPDFKKYMHCVLAYFAPKLEQLQNKLTAALKRVKQLETMQYRNSIVVQGVEELPNEKPFDTLNKMKTCYPDLFKATAGHFVTLRRLGKPKDNRSRDVLIQFDQTYASRQVIVEFLQKHKTPTSGQAKVNWALTPFQRQLRYLARSTVLDSLRKAHANLQYRFFNGSELLTTNVNKSFTYNYIDEAYVEDAAPAKFVPFDPPAPTGINTNPRK